MTGKQTALLPGNEDKVGYWLTPPELMKSLEDEFQFDYDACPYPRPAGFDGLQESWGTKTWCNPPFVAGTSLTEWARKAIKENRKGKTIVMIAPSNGWTAELLAAGAEIRLVGRVGWVNPKGEQQKRARWPSTLFVLRSNDNKRLHLVPEKETCCQHGRSIDCPANLRIIELEARAPPSGGNISDSEDASS